MGHSFYNNFGEKFDEKAAKNLLLLLENFDGEAAKNFRILLKDEETVDVDTTKYYLSMIKNDRFSEKAAKGFEHLLKECKSSWFIGDLIRYLRCETKAVAGFFLILKNCDETNAEGVKILIKRYNLKFFLKKCDSELAKRICMLLKYANYKFNSFLTAFWM